MGIGAVLAEAEATTSPWSLFYGLLGLVFVLMMSRGLESAFFKPRRLERALRAQGLRGRPYRFPAGDVKENARLNNEVRSKPMPLSHDVAPRVAPLVNNLMNEYGKFSFRWVGPFPKVTINDPELVREVLSNKFGHFDKSAFGRFRRIIANGLSNHNGEKWVKHRRILNPAFHVEKLKRMLPAFFISCSELVTRWDNLVGSDGSHEIDVWPELQNLTGDVISRTAFGSNYMEGMKIFQLQGELAERVGKAFQKVYIPGYLFLPTENNRRMNEISREIETILKGIIRNKERAIETGQASTDDLLDLLLESNMKDTEENGKPSLRMTTEDIIEECKLFYFAGMETTSVLLTWTMVVLSMHPQWQDRAREEVVHVFGKNKPDFESLSRLKTVTMILYEVLRLYPPLALLNRTTFKQMELGGITYPPGVMLELPIIFIHHDPEIWGNDADEFKPERFADGILKASNDKVAFFPFGWGPRICIGQNFALLEAKMGLSMILQHYSFELSPSYIHAPYTVITLRPQHGAQIKLTRL